MLKCLRRISLPASLGIRKFTHLQGSNFLIIVQTVLVFCDNSHPIGLYAIAKIGVDCHHVDSISDGDEDIHV